MINRNLIFFIVLFILAAISIYTIEWFPGVWVDEASYSDPAINFVQGKGFTATTWTSQSRDEYWASNVPLHQYALVAWLKIVGVSERGVRSLNVVFMIFTSIALWIWLGKTNYLRSFSLQIMVIASIWTGDMLSIIYRNGRPDTLTILLAVITICVFFSSSRLKNYWAFGIGALSLLAGLQLPPFIMIVLAYIFIFTESRKATFGFAAYYSLGVFVSLGLLLAWLQWHNSAFTFLTQTFASGYTMTGDVAQAVVYSDSKVTNRFLARISGLLDFNALYFRDISCVLISGYLFFISIYYLLISKIKNTIYFKILVLYLIIPPAMLILGRYPFYYSWMGFLVVLFGSAYAIQESKTRLIKALGIIVLVAAATLGLPHNFFIHSNVGLQEQEQVTNFVKQRIDSADWVYGDHVAFYACKRYAGEFFSLSYSGGRGLPVFPEKERTKITKLLIHPAELEKSIRKIGGNWKEAARIGDINLILFERE
jgi:hypothetical protein